MARQGHRPVTPTWAPLKVALDDTGAAFVPVASHDEATYMQRRIAGFTNNIYGTGNCATRLGVRDGQEGVFVWQRTVLA